MLDETRTRISRLVSALPDGDAAALDELFELLYHELREIARRQRRRWAVAQAWSQREMKTSPDGRCPDGRPLTSLAV